MVVFWTLHERAGHGETRYRKIKCADEFPADTDPLMAIEGIYGEFGRIADQTQGGKAPLSYAEVASHSIVHPYERGKIETWKATQEQLFSGKEWQRTVSYKPEV